MIITPALHNNLYNKLSSVIATEHPIAIDYNEHVTRIIATDALNKLARLKPHPEAIVGDPEDLMHVDWYEYGVLKQEYR